MSKKLDTQPKTTMSNGADTAQLQAAVNDAVGAKAAAAGFNDPQAYVENLKNQVQQAVPLALNDLNELVSLIVVTYQQRTMLFEGMEGFAESFIEKISEGNGQRYILAIPGADGDYQKNDFVPNNFTENKFVVDFIKFKDDQGNLAPGAERKRWTVVYSNSDLITYFINGQLSEFISNQILSKIGDSVSIYLYDKLMKALVDTANKGKNIQGTAQNLFDAITNEIIPELQKFRRNSNVYNTDKNLSEANNATHKEDIVMLMSPKVYSMIQTHLMSQLFNSAKIDLHQFVGQIHVPNNRSVKQNDIYVWEDVNYVADDKIYVIDRKDFYKLLTFIEFTGRQDFPLNMSSLEVLHLWIAGGYLRWGKSFTYTNAALTINP